MLRPFCYLETGQQFVPVVLHTVILFTSQQVVGSIITIGNNAICIDDQ
ncbi:MAG: hypothetical protein IPG86_12740 [Chitinophagaceae bacterium]|nr:hypothetical protein [Chitinophagaceae bacterium]